MSDDGEEMPIWLHWPGAIISSIIGMVFIVIIVTSSMAQLSTSDWDSTTGIIVDYDNFCDYNGEETHCQEDVVYTYIVEGDTYQNDVTNLGWTNVEYRWYVNREITLELFDVTNWDSTNDLQQIVDWFNYNSGWGEEHEFTVDYFMSACNADEDNIDNHVAQCVLDVALDEYGYSQGVVYEYSEPEDGDQAVVYYDQYDPQKSVLIPGWDGIEFGDFIILFFAIIGPSVLLITARKKGTFSEALNEFKRLAQTAKEIQGGMGSSGTNYVQSRARRTAGGTSRERSYNSVIDRLNLHSLQKDENAIKDRITHVFGLTPTQAQSFIQSEHVRLTLQLDVTPMPPMPPLSDTMMQSPVQNEERVNINQMDMMAVFANAMEENLGVSSPDSLESEPLPSSMPKCEHPGCNVTVNNTDFRCFKCRRTFCYDHKGTSVVCPECS
tara:strand:+ start:10875 stop:12188 length:1314 start_codon:yes stop_codon:yes gene_type:complete